MDISILIDTRERALAACFEGYPGVVITQLEVGDVIIKSERIKLVFERKTKMDLHASISDGRYREQKQRMLACASPWYCSYIIEGPCNWSESIETGMVIHTMYRDKMHIVYTRDVSDTAKYIKCVAEKCRANPSYFDANETHADYLACVKAKTKKIDNIDKGMCYILQLCQVPGVSQKIASEVAKVYPTLQTMLATLGSASYAERCKVLCRIPLVGAKKAEAIAKYMFDEKI